MNTTQLIPSPAPRLASRFAWAALASIGLAVFSLALAAPARAAGSSYPFAKWLVTLSFPNNQPLVELTTEIWSYNPTTGSATLVTSQTEPLNCTVSGNLQISNGVASFSGQEHIACEQPDMVDKIYQVSQGNLLVPPAAEVRDAWVRGEAAVAGNAPLNSPLPTHYHPDLQHAIARTGGGQAAQYLRVDGVQSTGVAYTQTAPYDIGARFKSRAAACEPWKPYDTRFRANGVGAPGSPAVINQVLAIGLQETTIYFGYSPAHGSHFQGSIKTLIVDPGACGIGMG
jgi:hypothetical protein